MTKLIVTDRSDNERAITGEPGLSLMEAIRDNGFDDLLALCGGVCSCATCHVYIDDQYSSLLPPMSEDEDALLDGATHRRPNSRLSCQITLDESLSGMKVTIAEED